MNRSISYSSQDANYMLLDQFPSIFCRKNSHFVRKKRDLSSTLSRGIDHSSSKDLKQLLNVSIVMVICLLIRKTVFNLFVLSVMPYCVDCAMYLLDLIIYEYVVRMVWHFILTTSGIQMLVVTPSLRKRSM